MARNARPTAPAATTIQPRPPPLAEEAVVAPTGPGRLTAPVLLAPGRPVPAITAVGARSLGLGSALATAERAGVEEGAGGWDATVGSAHRKHEHGHHARTTLEEKLRHDGKPVAADTARSALRPGGRGQQRA
jgi:hypothetical protein